MNVRKPVDYSAMFGALDTLMAADLPQMELYCDWPAGQRQAVERCRCRCGRVSVRRVS